MYGHRWSMALSALLVVACATTVSLMFTACGGGSAGGLGGGGTPPAGTITFKVNGDSVTMSGKMRVEKYQDGLILVEMEGTGREGQWREFSVDSLSLTSWPPTPMPYALTKANNSGRTKFRLVDSSGKAYSGVNQGGQGGDLPEFSLRIESISGNRVTGMFSCTIDAQSPERRTLVITEGRFNVPLDVVNVISQ